MTTRPSVDVNLFVYNAAATIAETIDSVLTQSWQDLRLTVIDNASTDDTLAIVSSIADPRVRLHRNRINVGPVLNCQRAFWHGQSDFVLPKTGDDLLAPDFIAEVMDTLLHHPQTVMCHAAGLIFDDDRTVRATYPPTHNLNAIDADPVARARHVMARYTSAPAFWGIYRRAAIERLAPLAYRPGWDHAVLAELALYGNIRAIDTPLFWRRHGGKHVADLARGCSQFTQRDLPLDDALADLLWHIPLVATAYGHIERLAVARIGAPERRALMQSVPPIFRSRWLPMMRLEAERFRTLLPDLLDKLAAEHGIAALWAGRQLSDALAALHALIPEADFGAERIAAGALSTSRLAA